MTREHPSDVEVLRAATGTSPLSSWEEKTRRPSPTGTAVSPHRAPRLRESRLYCTTVVVQYSTVLLLFVVRD